MFKHIQGDRVIWAIIILIALSSFLPVYSTSSNLIYVVGKGSYLGYLLRHFFMLSTGLLILYFVHKVPYKYFAAISVLFIPGIILLLIFTLATGTQIGGANASRWIHIPILGVGFQTSTLATLVVMVFTARYLSKMNKDQITFKKSLWNLWSFIAVVCMLILPANFSTAAILFLMVCMLLWIGGYPFKFLMYMSSMAIGIVFIFILLFKAFPSLGANRIDTWFSRIEHFSTSKKEGYQIENAKIAIASGGLIGRGAGKSIQKNFLPQSTSDFIFAIIVEEYGLLGTLVVLLVYIILLYRFFAIAKNAPTIFAKLLVIAVGFPIIFQAIINLFVATDIIPVTGQPLPLFSSGGTSIWMTFLAIGIVLSVSVSIYNQKKREALQNTEHF